MSTPNELLSVLDLEYRTTHPSKVSPGDRQELLRLRREQAARTFPRRSTQEIGYYIGEMGAAWEDPNRRVGGTLNKNQRYKDPRVTVAYAGNDRPVGLAYGADNASSNVHLGPVKPVDTLLTPLNNLADRILIHKKLNNDKYLQNRWYWLGDLVVASEYGPDAESVLTAVHLDAADEDQPFATYPDTEESEYKALLASWLLHRDDLEPQKANPFGPGSEAAYWERWSSPHVKMVTAGILHLPDMPFIVPAARGRHQIEL